MKEKCFKCGTLMKEHGCKIAGVDAIGLKCLKCGDLVFTEAQAIAAAKKIDRSRLKEKYTKKPVKIGNSYGILMPRDIVKVFNLDSKDARIDIKTDKSNNKIEITVL